MKIYIYPNGEVHEAIQPDMSDDWLIIESTTTLYEVTGLITTHFGTGPQAYQVWQEVLYHICAPLPCHGDNIAAAVAWAKSQGEAQ